MEVDVRDAEGLLKELDSLVGTLTDEQKRLDTLCAFMADVLRIVVWPSSP